MRGWTSLFLSILSVVSSAVFAAPLKETGRLDDIPMHYVAVDHRPAADTDIQLDGLVDEPVWQTVPAFDEMRVSIPGTGKPAPFPTETRLLPTEQGLYVGAILTQPRDSLVRRLTNRDEFIDRDNFGITLDTTGEGLFAYWFIVALGGSLADGKVLPERRYTNDWDGPWTARTAILDDGWSVEMFFPWSMLALPNVPGEREIGFAISRTVSLSGERYQWPGHSQTSPQFVTALNTMNVGKVKPRVQRMLIPYASTTFDKARDEQEVRIGADITWKPSPAFEVTAALNPDFGAVEADDLVLNLTALEVFFPEKRLFFLEGIEVFETNSRSSSGNNMRIYNAENYSTMSRRIFVTDNLPAPISLLNTRRIGGTATQVELPGGIIPRRGETDRPTQLLGAAKVTGASGKLRYGVFGAFEDDAEWLAADGQPKIRADGRDFGVVRALYETRFKNRYSLGYFGSLVSGPVYDAEVHAVDAHFAASSGRYGADLVWLTSDVDGTDGNGTLVDLSYRPNSRSRHTVRLDYFDETVDINDLGFLRRNDYKGAQYIYTYSRPEGFGPTLVNRGAITLDQRYNVSENQVIESAAYWRNTSVWKGRNTLRSALAYFPERWEDVDSRGNGAYRTKDRIWWDLLWSTDASKPLTMSFGAGGWQEHLGDWTYQGKLGFTWRPTDNFATDFDITYRARDGWLVYQGANNFGAYHGTEWQPEISANWFITANQQLRINLQWAGVRVDERGFYAVPEGDGALVPAARTLPDHDFNVSLLALQARYRWEIAPLTDLYVVYNRGNNRTTRDPEPFRSLFTDAFDDPLADFLIVKLRYRFGN